MRGAHSPEGEGLGRLDRHLPEPDLRVAFEHLLGHVVVSHRDPAGGDHHVALRPGGEGGAQRIRVVGDDAEVEERGAGLLEQALQHRTVGVTYPTRVQLGGVHGRQLVTGRHECHPGTSRDLRSGDPESGQNADVHRCQPGPRREHQLTAAHVASRRADRGSAPHRGPDGHFGALDRGVLDLDHRVGAGRHRGAGHDLERLARSHLTVRSGAGREIPDHREHRSRIGHVFGPDGEPVHRRVGEGRHVLGSNDIAGQDSSSRLPDADRLRLQTAHGLEDLGSRFLQPSHHERDRSQARNSSPNWFSPSSTDASSRPMGVPTSRRSSSVTKPRSLPRRPNSSMASVSWISPP